MTKTIILEVPKEVEDLIPKNTDNIKKLLEETLVFLYLTGDTSRVKISKIKEKNGSSN